MNAVQHNKLNHLQQLDHIAKKQSEYGGKAQQPEP
jgi:hypothetical protein